MIPGLDARKTQELLCYLLIFRNRPHPRETLAGILWGDNTTAHSKKYLRQSLWMLQRALESFTSFETPFLVVDENWISLNPKAKYWLDAAEFERIHQEIRVTTPHLISPGDAEVLRSAINLYQGDLLEGWYEDWCIFERERLQNIYLGMLEKLAGYCESCKDWESGLTYCSHILRYDRASERTYIQMMRLYFLSGDRTEALRQYERCTVVLREELGVAPSRKTRDLYEQMRVEQFTPLADTPLEIAHTRSPDKAESHSKSIPQTRSLSTALRNLRHFRIKLSQLQIQLEGHIQELEKNLQDDL
jgi:DNA-binding SARP family transcriptional activator